MKKLITLTLILLLGCSPTLVTNKAEATIGISCNRVFLDNQDLVEGRESTFNLIFYQGAMEGLVPRIYIYGPVEKYFLPEDSVFSNIKPNMGYQLRLRFKQPGDAIMLLIWEGEKEFAASKTIYLLWDGN